MAIKKRRLCSPAGLGGGSKRGRKPTSVPDWGQLHVDMLLPIFNFLSFIDVVQAKTVCSSWYSAANQLQSCTKLPQIPWLLIPPQEEEGKTSTYTDTKLFSIEQGRVYSTKNVASRETCNLHCSIGSSHGYIIFFNCESSSLFAFNPLTGMRVQFPAIDDFLGKVSDPQDDRGNYIVRFSANSGFYHQVMFSRQLREHFIQKAILTSDPRHSKSYALVLICCQSWKIALCRNGGGRETSWMYLDGTHAPFHDIMCHENGLYVLGKYGTLEVWDLAADCSTFPVRAMTIVSYSWSTGLRQMLNFSSHLYVSRFYLVESSGKVLLIARSVGEFVDEDGRAVHEEDLLTEKAPEPLVCPYRTLLFGLFKMDFEQKTWVEIETLDNDQAVFVGGNHSISASVREFSGCERNSIYFADDYWDRMDEDYLYGGHDMGVYNLKDKSVKRLHQFEESKIKPPPCWFLPNPW